MAWTCAAIDHGITIFSNGKIAPCCQIASEYLKPISMITDPSRFADLKTHEPPVACGSCVKNEANNIRSLRALRNATATQSPGLQFVDIRNTNLCNLKCRYCGPHFSNKWAEELNMPAWLLRQDINEYKNLLITDSLHWLYFTGGEPLFNPEHWQLLQDLVDNNRAANISLVYNTNLTTIKYKDINIIDIWKQFKSVTVQCSVDAIGEPLEYIRSGASWARIKQNIEQLLDMNTAKSISVSFTPVISILNLWFLKDLFDYAGQQKIKIDPSILYGPDYLGLDVIPDELKPLALEKVAELEATKQIGNNIIAQLTSLIKNNTNQCLIIHTISHVLLLDNLRNEKLFDLLPFKQLAIDKILKNHEYE
jgi:sulfatase maturation enzyme AslB (radical SAM superfamily)